MLCNLHTHTTFCDGKNTPEEVVLSAIEKGFDSIGFSGHGYTDFDLSYCIKDMVEYVSAINSLKEKYKNKIQIYLGVEEDVFCPCDKHNFDYMIASSHYVCVDGTNYPIDGGQECFQKCMDLFDNDVVRFADEYYKAFCKYISVSKADIIGHFDLITKYDEPDMKFLSNEKYFETAERYLKEMLKKEMLFEVNTGAMVRGLRSAPYPHERHLYTIKKNGGRVILSSDCHRREFLDGYFAEARALLRDVGFEHVYVLYNGEFIKDSVK